MKKIILLFILVSGFSFGQVENFSVENHKIFWEKVYETNDTPEVIESKIKQFGYFYDIEKVDGKLVMKFKDVKPLYREAGQSVGYASMYISSGVFFGAALIEFKENKYRVTVSNVKSIFEYLSITMNDSKTTITLEDPGLTRSGEFKSGFVKRDAKVLNYTFNEMFDISKYKSKTDNW